MSIKPITSKGTRDFSSSEVARRTYLRQLLQEAFETFGFQPIETPSFERLETLTGIYGEESDRLVFKIINSGEKVKKADVEALTQGLYQKFVHSLSEKALRYDLTVPFARYVAQHQNELSFPFRRYQIQPVWRADRPQHGRFQEFYQCDADIVGNNSLWQEIEMLSLYDNVFSKLKMDGVSIKINHRKILAGIVGFLGVESKLTSFTLTLDKLNKIGKEGVLKELQANDFSENALDTIEKLLEIKGSASEQLNTLEKLLVNQDDGLEGINELKFILSQLESSPLESVVLDFDITLARGLHYYTGMIVEVSAPETVKMGSIGGGGRYDDLTGKFGLKNMSGIGVSFGFERIYLVMEALELFPETLQTSANILFANFGDASTAIAYKHMNKLRSHGIACELYPNEVKLKKQLAYANDKKIARVILIGSQEIEKKEFVIKDMDTGIQISHPVKELLSHLIS